MADDRKAGGGLFGGKAAKGRGNIRRADQVRLRRWGPYMAGGGVLALLLLALLGFWLVKQAEAALFSRNSRFAIRTLNIETEGQIITADHVREYTRLSEGTNLFAIRIGDIREQFLKNAPMVKSVTLSRRLPDTLDIRVVERATVARLGRWRSLGVDGEGHLYSLRTLSEEVPLVTGYSVKDMRPGGMADASVMNALSLIEAVSRMRLNSVIRVASIDVSAPDCLELYLVGGEHVKMAWTDMGRRTPEARRALEQKLDTLARALTSAEGRGRRIVNLNLTFNDQYIPAQEY